MTIDTVCAARPSARTAELRQWDSLVSVWQHDLRRFHRLARELRPLALGSLGPVALSYDTARAVLRDRRSCRPKDLGLGAQGITSGPLWEGPRPACRASTAKGTIGYAAWSSKRSPVRARRSCGPR